MRNIGQIGVEKDRKLSMEHEENMRQTQEGEVTRGKFKEHVTMEDEDGAHESRV